MDSGITHEPTDEKAIPDYDPIKIFYEPFYEHGMPMDPLIDNLPFNWTTTRLHLQRFDPSPSVDLIRASDGRRTGQVVGVCQLVPPRIFEQMNEAANDRNALVRYGIDHYQKPCTFVICADRTSDDGELKNVCNKIKSRNHGSDWPWNRNGIFSSPVSIQAVLHIVYHHVAGEGIAIHMWLYTRNQYNQLQKEQAATIEISGTNSDQPLLWQNWQVHRSKRSKYQPPFQIKIDAVAGRPPQNPGEADIVWDDGNLQRYAAGVFKLKTDNPGLWDSLTW